ncbi:MAG: riboflavin synthase [Cyanobacteria bacterium J06639_1]
MTSRLQAAPDASFRAFSSTAIAPLSSPLQRDRAQLRSRDVRNRFRMFTGLVEALGIVEDLGDSQVRVRWLHPDPAVLADLALGDSVAVDGVCLTVATMRPDGFVADISPETRRRSTLDTGTGQHTANLERSLRAGGKIGGHFVTGHIDGIGQLDRSAESQNAWEMSFHAPEAIARYIVPKGSIAINGISLTVANVADNGAWFQVAVIPHTYEFTNLFRLQPGDRVNLEGDILGKYVEKLLAHGRCTNGSTSEIDLSFLAQHGYA